MHAVSNDLLRTTIKMGDYHANPLSQISNGDGICEICLNVARRQIDAARRAFVPEQLLQDWPMLPDEQPRVDLLGCDRRQQLPRPFSLALKQVSKKGVLQVWIGIAQADRERIRRGSAWCRSQRRRQGSQQVEINRKNERGIGAFSRGLHYPGDDGECMAYYERLAFPHRKCSGT